VRIFTGAPMPAGADTVFMQEDCRIDRGRVIV
jgi:molybdopterin molybdotransferase